MSVGMLDAIKVELALLKGLELAGYVPTVLTEAGPCVPYYQLAGVDRFVSWSDFMQPERVVIGTSSDTASALLVKLYEPLNATCGCAHRQIRGVNGASTAPPGND